VAGELVAGLVRALDKSNTTEYYVYDYQDNRVRSVVESNNQVQSQRDYLPLLTVVVWVNGEGLLPSVAVCLV
jgi:hypothetical protein